MSEINTTNITGIQNPKQCYIYFQDFTTWVCGGKQVPKFVQKIKQVCGLYQKLCSTDGAHSFVAIITKTIKWEWNLYKKTKV